MRRLLVGVAALLGILAFAIGNADSIFYFTENPMGLVFRPWWLGVEFYYPFEGEQQYLGGVLRAELGPLTLGAGAQVSGNLLGGDYEKVVNVVGGAALVLPGFFAGFSALGNYNLDYEEFFFGGSVPIVVGIGSRAEGGYYYSQSKGGAGIYYLTNDLISISPEGVEINGDFDFKNGTVGIYIDSVGRDGGVTMDVQLDLRFLDSQESILNYLDAQLTLNLSGLVVGGKFFGGEVPKIDGVVGLDVGVFRVFGNIHFDTQFNMTGWEAYAKIQL